jgi:DNA polymerase sigma
MVDALTQFKVDISFNIPGGIEAAVIVKEFLTDPTCGGALKPLMLIMKQYLAQRLMNEVFLGGLGSYGLLIMIASFLKVILI